MKWVNSNFSYISIAIVLNLLVLNYFVKSAATKMNPKTEQLQLELITNKEEIDKIKNSLIRLEKDIADEKKEKEGLKSTMAQLLNSATLKTMSPDRLATRHSNDEICNLFNGQMVGSVCKLNYLPNEEFDPQKPKKLPSKSKRKKEKVGKGTEVFNPRKNTTTCVDPVGNAECKTEGKNSFLICLSGVKSKVSDEKTKNENKKSKFTCR